MRMDVGKARDIDIAVPATRSCRMSPIYFLTGYCKRLLNQVLVSFALVFVCVCLFRFTLLLLFVVILVMSISVK